MSDIFLHKTKKSKEKLEIHFCVEISSIVIAQREYILRKTKKKSKEKLEIRGAKLHSILVGQLLYRISKYWWCKLPFYTTNSRIIGGADAPTAPPSLVPLEIHFCIEN